MDSFKKLNKKQKEAVTAIEGPILVAAGAGTGKTKVITHRIAFLISRGVKPEQILAVTFTNKAAKEMANRITSLVKINQKEGELPTIGTFHSIAADILRKYGEKLGIPANFRILSEQEGFNVIKTAIEEKGLESRQFQPSAIQSLISQKKANFMEKNEFLKEGREDFFLENAGLIWEEYENYLKKNRALDFEDLIAKTVCLFQQFPEILEIYQNKWQYIHIDEYQDTDHSQYKLINSLAQRHKNICAVGDEDQSIYGFRGADFRNILNFEKDWPEAKIIILEKNYRSTKTILDAANAVIVKNKIRRQKELFSTGKRGKKIIAFEARDEKEEANFAAGKIKELIEKDHSPSSIAVLCRANFQFPVFEKAFLENFLPYRQLINQDEFIKDNNGHAIRLMTVHSAKGLEFKNVFIVGLEKGLFPYIDNEEERRLFYVALTRSQERLFLSYSRYRNVFNYRQINKPSQFLSDIPKNLIKWERI